MIIKKTIKFFSSLNIIAKTSTIVGILAGATGIMSWLGITPDFITNKDTNENKSDSTNNTAVMQPIIHDLNEQQPKQIKYSESTKAVSKENSNSGDMKSDSNFPDFINSTYRTISSPYKLALVIKNKESLDRKFSKLTEFSLSSKGVKCSSTLFNERVLNHYDELESPLNEFPHNQLLGLTEWYVIGEITETEKTNSVNKSDITAVVSFDGYLIQVAEADNGTQIPLNITEREAGESGIATERARKKLSEKLSMLLTEQL